jgi:putative ABC transport system permease protein
VITLEVGIGANTGNVSAVEAALLRSLPFEDPDRIVLVQEANTKNPSITRNPELATNLEWKRRARSFEGIETAVAYFEAANLGGIEEPQRVRLQFVSPGLLNLLGHAEIGTVFTTNEAQIEQAPEILISHGLWVRE